MQWLFGCAHLDQSSIFYWGDYEDMIYKMYAQPGSVNAQIQIQTLTRDIQQAANVNKKLAPGVYAHLGMMHAMQGNLLDALDALNMEKKLYPESSILIDGMIERAQQTPGSL